MSVVHPLLTDLFAAWDAAGLRWCLLRGRDSLGEPPGDVDVLVDPADVDRLARAVTASGFVRWRSWTLAGQHSFIAHDPAGVGWLPLHITDRLAFGPRHALELMPSGPLVDRRVEDGGVWVLAPGDELWVTLLHALLDKDAVSGRHRRRLAALAGTRCSLSGPVPAALAGAVPRLDPAALLAHVEAGRWNEVEAIGRELSACWSRRFPSRLRRMRNSLALAGHRLGEVTTAPGPCVALLAPDGAGKTTLAEQLASAFPVPGRTVYLGAYGLAGPKLARRAPEGIAAAIRIGWLLRRRVLVRWYRARRWVVVLDRHPHDVLASPAPSSCRGRVRRSLIDACGPRVDAVLILDAPAALLHERRPEHEVQEHARRRASYLALADMLPNVVVLDAAQDDLLVDEALAATWDRYRARVNERTAGDVAAGERGQRPRRGRRALISGASG